MLLWPSGIYCLQNHQSLELLAQCCPRRFFQRARRPLSHRERHPCPLSNANAFGRWVKRGAIVFPGRAVRPPIHYTPCDLGVDASGSEDPNHSAGLDSRTVSVRCQSRPCAWATRRTELPMKLRPGISRQASTRSLSQPRPQLTMASMNISGYGGSISRSIRLVREL
jgi:hypothetical protein